MTGVGCSLVTIVAQTLQGKEREAALGEIVEAFESALGAGRHDTSWPWRVNPATERNRLENQAKGQGDDLNTDAIRLYVSAGDGIRSLRRSSAGLWFGQESGH